MDNTVGEHVTLTRLVEGEGGQSAYKDGTLSYDRALGPLRQSETIDATEIRFRWWPADFSGTFSQVAGKRVVLVTEGAVRVDSGDGKTRTFRPGDVLELSLLDQQDYRIQAADGLPFRAAIIELNSIFRDPTKAALPQHDEQSLPYVRNVTGIDQRSHFEDGVLPYFVERDGSLSTSTFALTKFQYVYAAADLRYDFHNAPQRQIVLPLTGGTQGENGDGSRRIIPPGGVYFGEDTTGQGHITSAVNDAIRFSVFAYLA